MRALTPAFVVLRVLSWLVPSQRRRDWLEEWRAELTHAWTASRGSGRASLWLRIRLVLRAVEAVGDAVWLRRSGSGSAGAAQGLRIAVRSLWRRPGFSLSVIGTLALGMGSATATFSLLDGLMLRPLPFPEPERLVSLYGPGGRLLDPDATRTWELQADVFEDVKAHTGRLLIMTGAGTARSYRAEVVEPGFLKLLGVRPTLGRSIDEGDAVPGAHGVVLLSESVWREAFAADRTVVGRTIRLNDEPHTVIGVLPPTLRRAPGGIVDLVVPLAERDPARGLYALGKLRTGLSVEAAQARSAEAATILQAEQPRESGWELGLRPLGRYLDEPTTRGFWTLAGAVLLLLVLACANAAGLLILRGMARRPELDLRIALGSSRGALVRLVLTESIVLALCAGLVGAALGSVGSFALVGLLQDSSLMRFSYTPVSLDARVFGFAFAVTVVTGVLFGVLPALRAGAAAGTTGRATSSRRDVRVRAGLQVGQIALAVVLLWGAGLFGRSFASLISVPVGYDADHLLHLELVSLEGMHGDSTLTLARAEELDARLGALPGVLGVARAFGPHVRFGETLRAGDAELTPEYIPYLEVDTAFFRVSGIPIVEGRGFVASDAEGDVVVVDRDLARALSPSGGVVGRRLTIGSDPPRTVVGISGDMKILGPRDPLGSYLMFQPVSGEALRSSPVWIRTAGEPAALVSPVRSLVRTLDPAQPIERLETGRESLAGTVVYARFLLAVVAVFSVVALILAAIGVYGLVSFTVAQRTRELGIRIALGARYREVIGGVVGRGLLLGLLGVLLGLGLAAALSRTLSSLLYGVAPMDPLSLLTAAAVLLGCCAVAAFVPAQRAASVRPSDALRAE